MESSKPVMIATIIIALLVVVGGGMWYLNRSSGAAAQQIQTPPPSFIDPTTLQPKAGVTSSSGSSPANASPATSR